MIKSQTSSGMNDSDFKDESEQKSQRHRDKKQFNPLEDLELLGKFVYKLNYHDESSEDYVYYQLLLYLAEKGSFSVTELDRKISFRNKNGKKVKIERRKLKKILEGTAKGFSGFVPLNYVFAAQEWKHRGGNQEVTYYPTEKGIMASIGYHSYKKNINMQKILMYYRIIGKPYQKFVSKFIRLQIQVYLSYYFVQGISLGLAKENSSEYDRFRNHLVDKFEIKIVDKNLETQFRKLLQKFNVYRKIHLRLSKKREIIDSIWNESRYVRNKSSHQFGLQGWYSLQSLTAYDSNLKQVRHDMKGNNKKSKETRVEILSKPKFLYSLFQDEEMRGLYEKIQNNIKVLGLERYI